MINDRGDTGGVIILMALLVCVVAFIAIVYQASAPFAPDIEDRGNNLYYFRGCCKEFTDNLNAFEYEHPELEIVDITEEGNGLYGHTSGYYVQFKVKEVK